MLEHVSIPQQIGLSVLVVATVVWTVGLVRMLRRDRTAVAVWHESRPLASIPSQAHPTATESVELSADERAAFAVLVRQLTDDR